ncbi:MAG TPA: hypothetical protein VNK44_04115 [Candidatus Nitrosotenuis sp.]|nr:hypothetical protein [Candidatus Nitrosotenuis sp.]
MAEFLRRIGFSILASRSEFKKSSAEIAREIDLLATFQNCLFIKVSTLKSGRTEKIITFFYRWEKQKNLIRLQQKHQSLQTNVMRIFFDLSKVTPENKSEDVEEITEEKGNRVFYKDDFEKFYYNTDTNLALADFLGSNWFENSAKVHS